MTHSYGFARNQNSRNFRTECTGDEKCKFKGAPHYIDCPKNPLRNIPVNDFENKVREAGLHFDTKVEEFDKLAESVRKKNVSLWKKVARLFR